MNNMFKKLLALAVVFTMVFSMAPAAAFATETDAQNDNTIAAVDYETLVEAFAKAEDGDVIVLQDSFAMDASVSNTKKVTLDLNGKTITGTDTTEKNFGLINNTGVLTIKDSVGGGAILLTATVNSGWNRYSAVISNNPGGSLIVNGGTLEHLGGTDMAYGIDSLTNGTIGDVSVVINGGAVKSTYRAIRQFLNSDSKKNELIINGGVVEGTNKGVFFHDPSTKANNGTLVIGNDATVSSVYLYVTEGSTEWPVKVSISTEAVAAENITSKNIPEGLELQDNNGVLSVGAPALPNAIVSQLDTDELTFAMNFKIDEITEEQGMYYANWFADFELTINKDVTFNNDGSADGWLAGQYDSYSSSWITVPFGNFAPVSIKANETVKVMAFAAEALGSAGLKFTCQEIYETVRDFSCGVYFDEEFLAANPDLEVKLELKMYNPENEAEGYVIGESYTYTTAAPELPSATVTEIENEDLTFAMNFKVDPVTMNQLSYYGNWFADFELTINKDVDFNADGTADGWLSGQYDEWSENWVNVPFGKFAPATIKANEPLRIMAFAAELMGEPGLKYTYQEVYEFVRDFDCGVFFDDEFLAANPDLEVKLELKMYNPANEAESYVIGETYIYKNPIVAQNTTTNKAYETLAEALLDSTDGETVILLKDVTEKVITVFENTTLDLNGHTVATGYVSSFGDIIDSSAENTGLLEVAPNRIMLRDENKQLPVRDGDGYRFVEVLKINTAYWSDDKTFVFDVRFEPGMLELLKNGQESTGVTIQVRASWLDDDGLRTQNFVYKDEVVHGFLESYKPSTGGYGSMFFLALDSTDGFEDLTFTAVAVSTTGVGYSSADYKV